ncbi:kinetoplast-associated protein-like protein [Leishmania major strain Friedlin]|uniref:Kinetoplast-associated protein-like protein n=1 Tax=Leishmania major TaxID=5664 RepID=Q4QJE9_LEIMA|nr:kinetoplast-associated protein-like protein [Leishmania major strain Friedlin]CAG9568233.1 kinetoplast-associated_protein-like_protein [Leishmania major strain Friedlin]CAJ01973.1 kinetoplast-associated protein-like protein [Leishmania major strain Friedlin]|eukprot:XP_001687530.1 kinetoplast-associated protein-like protein [Leishmania major strain Friedlin]
MQPRLVLPSSQPLRISAQHPVRSSSTAPSSSSAAARPRALHGVSIDSAQAPNVAAVAVATPLPPPSSSSRLLQEIEETRKLLRTFRSLKERGASRAELADLHLRVKALKAAQQRQQPNSGACKAATLPLAASTTADAEAAVATAAARPSLACSPEPAPPLSCTHRHAGVTLHEGEAGWTTGSSHSLHQPQQRGVEEAHVAHCDGRLPEGRHHHHHRHRHHDVRVDRAASLSISTKLSKAAAQGSTAVRNGAINAVSSGSAGICSAVTLQPGTASAVPGSLVQINSIVFAIALAEAHTRRDIAQRWERRWLRHWANFKEERIAIALRPPTTTTAALSRPQGQLERWAEAAPMALPREWQQWHQAVSTATATVEGSSVATTTAARTVGACPAPVPGKSVREAFAATTSSPAVVGLQETPSLSAGHRSGEEARHGAEEQEETIPDVDDTAVDKDSVVWTSPPPQHQQHPAPPATERDLEASACAAADATAEAAAAVRNVEDEEVAARTATESAAAEARKRIELAEVTARLRAEEAREALQSLMAAEAGARVTLEGDEARLRISHVAAERDGAQRVALAAAEAESRRRAQEEQVRQEAAARAAAAKREEEKEREAAARRAAEAQLQAAADIEAAERRSVEQQWQEAVRLSESLLSERIKDAVAAAPPLAHSKGIRAPKRPLCDELAMMEDAQAGETADAQACLRERQQAAEQCLVAFGAAADAVLGEWISAAATVAEQAASVEAARRRKAEEAAAQAKAVVQERASAAEAARAAVARTEDEGRVALAASEEEVWQRLQLQHGADVEAARLAALAAEGKAARHRAEEEAAAMTATLCSVVAELSKNLVDGCVAEAARQVSEGVEADAVEELQMQRRERVEGEEALARDDMYGNALDELTRLREDEAAAEVRKRMEVEAVAAAKEQQQRVQAAAQYFQISELSEALLLEFLHDAASAAVAASTATVANGCLAETSPLAALPEGEEGAASAVMEDGQQQQQHHHHHPSADDAAEELDARAEQRQGGGVDSPDKANVDTSAPEAVAATASLSLSPSSSAGPSSFFVESVSADATPKAVTTGVPQGHAVEGVGLLSPTVFVHVVDGLLSDVLRDAAMEAQRGGAGAVGAISEVIASRTQAGQRAREHRKPLPNGSEASFVSVDHGSSHSTLGCSPPWEPQPKPLELPLALVVRDAAGDRVPQVQYTGGELNDCAEADVVVGGAGNVTAFLAEVADAGKCTPHQRIVSPLLIPSMDVVTASTSSISTASVTDRRGRGCARGAAGATATASSPLHCFSTASSVDDDDDAACSSLTAPGAPRPLNLLQHSVLSPLLCQQHGGNGGVHNDGGEASTPAGSEAAAGTTTVAALADRASLSENSRARPQLPESTGTGDRDATSDADGMWSAVVTMNHSVMEITEDLRAFQLDAPPPAHDVAEQRAGVRIAAHDALTADAMAAVADSLEQRAVHDASLLFDSRGQSAVPNTDSDRQESHDAVKVDHAAAPPFLFASAQSHEQSTVEGKSSGSGSGGGTSSSTCAGDVEAHAEKRVSIAEMGSGFTSGDAREATLRATRSLSPAAAAVAAEGIAGSHAPLSNLSTLVSAVAAPNDFVARLRQQEEEKKVAAHQQNRYLTSRELALVAARYLTSEAAAADVMEVGPTTMLSSRAVALVLSVGLVRASTLENRRARSRMVKAEKGDGSSARSDGGTAGGGVLVGENGLQKLTPGGGADSAMMDSPDAPHPPIGGGGDGGGFPTGIIGEAGAAGDDECVDVQLVSPTARGRSRGGDLSMPEPTASSVVGDVAHASGDVKGTNMSGGPTGLGSRPLSPRSSSIRSASQPTAAGGGKGALAANPAQQQAGVRDKLPADWATALRGVAERVARDFIDYASRCVLLGQGEGQSNQDHLRTARRIHIDALAYVDVQALFTQELQPRDVERLTSYYVELATNGPRDRVDPLCAPAALGEHNIFGHRSSVRNEDIASFDNLDTASTTVFVPPTRPGPLFASPHLLPSSKNRLLSAATSIHVRRAGLLHLVLEQCVSNVLHDLVGDTVGWLWTACLQAAPPGAAPNGTQ